VELELRSSNGQVRVDVADSGPGVPPERREVIFQPFVSQDMNGTGLGLPIASELAIALGGRIELEDGARGGSRFRLVLPVTNPV
jgi:signal transduction histidine kinase